jgi:excisionase family DNA binding protein
MSLSTLTPQQAAVRAQVSRGTIMNAIKDGHLAAIRDNRNRWQIAPDDLVTWLGDRTAIITVRADNSDTSPDVEKDIRIADLEAELKGKDQQITLLERELGDWKAQAQELARRDLPQVQLALPARRRWWPF